MKVNFFVIHLTILLSGIRVFKPENRTDGIRKGRQLSGAAVAQNDDIDLSSGI